MNNAMVYGVANRVDFIIGDFIVGERCFDIVVVLTGAVTTPLDVIKTRLMVQGIIVSSHFRSLPLYLQNPIILLPFFDIFQGSAKQYQRIVDCVQTIVREEGAPALLKGIGPRVLWIGIGGSIFFGVLESTKITLAQRHPNTVKETKEGSQYVI
ncbi:Mitochondrial substrate/solute carrier [Arabidopsis thaliana x Arabidopsis arenosa]|uniref:Mitochondrial substrate/solute carrier n=1 Tax=Arabidopsis thaliana x Arabidopsis arenosa TaxID=1240361 RepID=A0A8T2BZT9_9BRAS|nr:Mitochondrial substrate/solute carrier [Arabidopsis thaliana x Arabidopsis arenosa]KAG7592496.1 Mitochondrial substrate/solute carrier [Arabidopsis thaliana x Arabidopsis arenosa]